MKGISSMGKRGWLLALILEAPGDFSPLNTLLFGVIAKISDLIGGLAVWHIFLFFHILGIIIPTDFHIFQRARYTTNQPCIWVPLRMLLWSKTKIYRCVTIQSEPDQNGRFNKGTAKSSFLLASSIPSGKHTKTMEDHHFEWEKQLFRLGHFQ